MRRPKVVAAFAAGLVAIVAAGSLTIRAVQDEGKLGGGPLESSFSSMICLGAQADNGERFSFGFDFANPSESPLTINGISLQSVRGMKLLGIVRLPDTKNGQSVGAISGWPARNLTEKTWEAARPLQGVTLQPGEAAHVVFGFELISERGRASGIVITYELDDRAYEAIKPDYFVMGAWC